MYEDLRANVNMESGVQEQMSAYQHKLRLEMAPLFVHNAMIPRESLPGYGQPGMCNWGRLSKRKTLSFSETELKLSSHLLSPKLLSKQAEFCVHHSKNMPFWV